MSDDVNAAPPVTEKILAKLDQLIQQQRRLEVVSLAAALLGSRRKSLSVTELLEVTRDIQFARYPMPNNPDYQEWAVTKDERLSRIYK